jgi:hypothetical protein
MKFGAVTANLGVPMKGTIGYYSAANFEWITVIHRKMAPNSVSSSQTHSRLSCGLEIGISTHSSDQYWGRWSEWGRRNSHQDQQHQLTTWTSLCDQNWRERRENRLELRLLAGSENWMRDPQLFQNPAEDLRYGMIEIWVCIADIRRWL